MLWWCVWFVCPCVYVLLLNYIKIQNQLQLKNGTVDDSLAVSTFTAYAAAFTHQINSRQCEQKVGWRKNVAINLCPLTYPRTGEDNSNWSFGNQKFKLIKHYLMYTTAHSTSTSIESGTFLELLVNGHSLLDFSIGLGLIYKIERVTMPKGKGKELTIMLMPTIADLQLDNDMNFALWFQVNLTETNLSNYKSEFESNTRDCHLPINPALQTHSAWDPQMV